MRRDWPTTQFDHWLVVAFDKETPNMRLDAVAILAKSDKAPRGDAIGVFVCRKDLGGDST